MENEKDHGKQNGHWDFPVVYRDPRWNLAGGFKVYNVGLGAASGLGLEDWSCWFRVWGCRFRGLTFAVQSFAFGAIRWFCCPLDGLI